MKEFTQLIDAYDLAKADGIEMALATVVQVDGSAYRRPGARMLVTQDGRLTGAISGGCLEGDALRKAQAVIFQQKSMLVTYDTTDEDDQKFGIGLGCNGIIHLLIEPLDVNQVDNPVELIRQARSTRETSLLLTFFSIKNSKKEQIGTIHLTQGLQQFGSLAKVKEEFHPRILQEITTFEQPSSRIQCFDELDELSLFFELIHPPLQILLFGAGNDTLPVAQLAALLGHEVILVDGRKALATNNRFPTVQRIIQGPANEVMDQIETDLNTVALLMTHNFDYELVLLEKLSQLLLPYIGILGPKRKTEKLLERLQAKGIAIPTGNLYAPIGLDLGAETSEEIALAILAEIAAVVRKRKPSFLRDKQGPIHDSGL